MLAVVIPYYKYTFFEETLKSLANQTNKDFKVYIGDDASPENPAKLINRFSDSLAISYRRFNSNIGRISLTQQWERCIAMTAGEEWLMVLGDDDCLGENCIAEFYKRIPEVNDASIQVIRFSTIEINGVSEQISKKYIHPEIELAVDSFYRKFFKRSRSSLSEYVFRREAYEKARFVNLPLAWGADDLAWLYFTNFGEIFTINEAVVYFRLSGANISRKGYEEEVKKESKYFFFSRILDFHLKKFNKAQRLHLLLFYEQLVYNSGKGSITFWIKMSKNILMEREYILSLKFTRRFLINSFRQ